MDRVGLAGLGHRLLRLPKPLQRPASHGALRESGAQGMQVDSCVAALVDARRARRSRCATSPMRRASLSWLNTAAFVASPTGSLNPAFFSSDAVDDVLLFALMSSAGPDISDRPCHGLDACSTTDCAARRPPADPRDRLGDRGGVRDRRPGWPAAPVPCQPGRPRRPPAVPRRLPRQLLKVRTGPTVVPSLASQSIHARLPR